MEADTLEHLAKGPFVVASCTAFKNSLEEQTTHGHVTSVPVEGNHMTLYKHKDWTQLINAPVEVRQHGRTIRSGIVDSVMPDSSALWIAAEGVQPRQLFDAALGYEVWVAPQEQSGAATYRLTTDLLFRSRGGQPGTTYHN